MRKQFSGARKCQSEQGASRSCLLAPVTRHRRLASAYQTLEWLARFPYLWCEQLTLARLVFFRLVTDAVLHLACLIEVFLKSS